MKKIIREKDILMPMKVGIKEVEVWIASDGVEFYGKDGERECEAYETCLLEDATLAQIRKITSSFYMAGIHSQNFPDIFYHASNDEELAFLKKYLGYGSPYASIEVNDIEKGDVGFSGLNVGDTFGMVTDDAGDYKPTYYFYTLEYVRNLFAKFLDETS